jgi:predicted ATPase
LKKVVFTGGPFGGKTSVLEAVQTTFKCVVVPEAATLLMSGGFPIPGVDIDYTYDWQYNFQKAVCAVQESLEDTYSIIAEKKEADLLICDRGIMDGAAYFGQDFCYVLNINENEALDRYDNVIHLETLAATLPELYGNHNNKTRYESVEKAIEVDASIMSAWARHKSRLVVAGLRTEDSQTLTIINYLTSILND